MTKRRFVVFTVFLSFLFSTGLLLQCNKDDEDENKNGKNGKGEPIRYDQTMIGWAFGDEVYQYFDGYWDLASESIFNQPILAANFIDRSQGYAITNRHIYHYVNGVWTQVTPGSFPLAAMLFDIARMDDGSYWFAARDIENNGYLVRIGAGGESQIVSLYPDLSSVPMKLYSIMTAPGDGYLHMVVEVEGFFQHIAWNGTDRTSDPIIANDPEAPTAAVNDIAQAPDGSYWAVGWDMADGEPIGVFWRRGESTWDRRPAVATSECKTHSVRKLTFTSENTGYAIADCLWSQIYSSSDLANWQEMELPGAKNENYIIDDFQFLDDTRGWAVGYYGDWDEPLLLLRDTTGWHQGRSRDQETGDRLHAVALFDFPQPGAMDDDTTDDDTTDDDTAMDDDTGADDDATVP